ncbi:MULTISPECIES: hypothetical protein [unclassified Halomonas]|uniref:hypothetical protein n=1 Tax=unclassified Halomonas TaxID=2609666 RepID=UPI00207673EF|nr:MULTISPECIES: hypothetical protein [unclassified Halomonas]
MTATRIQNHLEQGKPLSPEIAKRFNDFVYRELPHYYGYKWRHVEADVVFIEATTKVVVDIITSALIR